MIDSEASTRLPIDLGRATTVGSLLLVLVFLVKAYAVARYSLTTMTGLVVATPVQVALGTISFYAYLVMPALALATGWLTVRRLTTPDRARVMAAAWPILGGITVVSALMSPVEYLETGLALLAVCLRLELRIRGFLRRGGAAGPVPGWSWWRPHDRWSWVPDLLGLPRRPATTWRVRVSSWALLAIAVVGAIRSPQFRVAGLVLVAFGVVAEAPFSVLLWQVLHHPGVRKALRLLPAGAGPTTAVDARAARANRALAGQLQGRTLGYLGAVAVIWYFVATVDTPWVPAQLYVLSSPVEVSTQDKSVANRVLDVERVRALIGFPLTEDGGDLTVLDAGTRRIVHMPAAAVRAQPLCHSDEDQLIGQRPLLWQLLGVDYGSHNINCETLRELVVPPRGLAFNPTGTVLAGAGWDGAVGLWNSATGRALGTPAQPAPEARVPGSPESGQAPYPVAFDPAGTFLAAAGPDGRVSLCDTATYQIRLTLPAQADLTGHPAAVTALAFTPDGTALVAAADDAITVWDLTTTITAAGAHGGAPVGSSNGATARTPKRMAPASTVLRPSPGDAVNAIAVTGRGSRTILAAGGDDDRIRVWDLSDPASPLQLGASFPVHGTARSAAPPGNVVYAIAISPDGSTLAAAGGRRDMARGRFPTTYAADADVRLWNLARPAAPTPVGKPLTGHTGAVNALAFSRDGAILASGSSDSTVRLWDVSSPGRPLSVGEPLTGHTGAVNALAFRPVDVGDITVLATTGTDQTIRLWELPAARTRTVLTTP
jgi:WD40 repeat protein